MNTHGIPNNFFISINPSSQLILIPLFDQFLYPLLRKHNIAFTPLKRITAGFAAAFISLAWAAVLQAYIYKYHPCGYHANSCARNAVLLHTNSPTPPISAWWQAGPYIFTALSELLAVITGMEYCFSKAPQNMKSFIFAVYLFMTAIAGAISQAFVGISDDPLLIWNYSIVSGLVGVGSILFWLTFKDLDKEDVEITRRSSRGNKWEMD
jgi:POT family proton-dependent oligopeptide transporter